MFAIGDFSTRHKRLTYSAVSARGLCPRGTILLIFCIDEVTCLIALAPLLGMVAKGSVLKVPHKVVVVTCLSKLAVVCLLSTLFAVILQNRIDYSIHFYEFVCSELISSFILLGKRIPSFFSSISSNSSIIDLKENNI